jgi:hypothetical protein
VASFDPAGNSGVAGFLEEAKARFKSGIPR